MGLFSRLGKGLSASVFALVMAAFAGGCQGYKANFISAYRAGNYPIAEQDLLQEGGDAIRSVGHRDRLLFLLEQGAVTRTEGNLQASSQALDDADKLFQEYDRKADVRIGRSVIATMSNLAAVDYEGYGYDRIMANAYKALNYMELGNLDYARAELKRVAYAQQLIERRKASKIRDAEDARREQGDTDVNRTMNDPSFKAKTSELYGNLPNNSAKAVYANAFAEYLQGIFLLHAGDASDHEVGRVALRSTLSMIDNEFVRQDVELADRISNGEPVPPMTYIIFETGIAPKRVEVRIDVPIFIFNMMAHDTGVDYVGVAFPRLVDEPGGMPFLNVRTASGTVSTQMLVNMDSVIGREFKDELPSVITKTLISAGVKVAAAYAANRATNNNVYANILTRVATTVYQASVNVADVRTWRSLPKMIVIARVPTPDDGQVNLMSPMGYPAATVRVQPKMNNVIWARGPGDTAPLACRTFVLKPN